MEHGAVSKENLKEVCFVVGRTYGVRNLGRLLYEVTLVASDAGRRKSRYGGVCSISFERWQRMLAHSDIYEYRKEILKAFGIDLKRITFTELAKNPQLSLLITAAWFLANCDAIPKHRVGRAEVFSKWWFHMPLGQYMHLTEDK
ncbi:hypothetical protein Q9F39_004208 [Vibrio fluvialis]|nr:hypothetical protein [Vibrio fluvialis]